MEVLKEGFFQRKAPEVARDLLGKFIVRRLGNTEISLMINETEAYCGFEDLASHASKGKTNRNKAMFETGGCFYIYLVYGIYHMINIVTAEKDYPSAVLLRGAGDIDGPGKLAKHLKVDLSFNYKKAIDDSDLWFENRGVEISDKDVKITPRIGVQYAKEWSQKPYRFLLK